MKPMTLIAASVALVCLASSVPAQTIEVIRGSARATYSRVAETGAMYCPEHEAKELPGQAVKGIVVQGGATSATYSPVPETGAMYAPEKEAMQQVPKTPQAASTNSPPAETEERIWVEDGEIIQDYFDHREVTRL